MSKFQEVVEADVLTPAQFAARIGVTERWVRARLGSLPGVIRESREVVLIHWPTYIEARTRKSRKL